MKKIIIQIFLIMILASCTSNGSLHSMDNKQDYCIDPVAEYSVPILAYYEEDGISIMPGFPWMVGSSIPDSLRPQNSDRLIQYTLKGIRYINGSSEIWILGIPKYDISDLTTENCFYLIYNTKSKEWKKISALVNSDNSKNINFISDLYIMRDGRVWGKHSYVRRDTSEAILSVYDENNDEFILDEKSILLSTLVSIPSVNLQNKVLFDLSGKLWILAEDDGIYKYDLETGIVDKVTDLFKGSIYGAEISPFGEIYFVSYISEDNKNINETGNMFVYSPETDSITQVKIPNEALGGGEYIPSDFLFDELGSLWIKNFVYREENGQWHKILFSPIFLTDKWVEGQTNRKYNEANLYLESTTSDGRLWYTARMSGTYMTDPNEGKWCWVTTEKSLVLEDSEGYLWLIADESLYRRSLKQE